MSNTKTKKLSNKLNKFESILYKKGVAFKTNEPLKKYTTFKIGGPADILAEARSREELIFLIKTAHELQIPYTMLGWGSNVLISDKGIRGLVIKNKADKITVLEKGGSSLKTIFTEKKPSARLDQLEKEKYYNFEDLDYDESDKPQVLVEIESGAALPIVIMTLIRQGITGLQWFGGIPGTVGGAVYNNIHGGKHFLSEYIEAVLIIDPSTMKEKTIQASECDFSYDFSRFHRTKEIILGAKFRLYKGEAEKAKHVFVEWTRRKKAQPQRSAGCVWQNISEKDKQKLKLESSSWGYIIDKILKLKGREIGGAQISTKHAAFIENIGNAKASEVLALMDLVKKESKKKLGIVPKSEIFLLGEF